MYDGGWLKGMTYHTIKRIFMHEALYAFDQWIRGQTCGVHPKTGKVIIYGWDIERFIIHSLRNGRPATSQPADYFD